MWATCIKWWKDKHPKYGFPVEKISQMQVYINYFKSLALCKNQPFIFYIDARWSSVLLIQRLNAAQLYGVLSCSQTVKPQQLMKWMRTDLAVRQWWSIGYPQAKANLITIRTKKKVYLSILTNWATCRPVNVTYHKRKHPAGEYQISAPWVQKEYNTYKAKVDQWNKALLSCWRIGRFIGAEVLYTHFFIHAWVLQAYHLYQASTGISISQLEFRKSLLQELLPICDLQEQPTLLVREGAHWPISQHPHKKHCQILGCGSSCSFYCSACDIWGCSNCLYMFHFDSARAGAKK